MQFAVIRLEQQGEALLEKRLDQLWKEGFKPYEKLDRLWVWSKETPTITNHPWVTEDQMCHSCGHLRSAHSEFKTELPCAICPCPDFTEKTE